MSYVKRWHPLVKLILYINLLIMSMCFDHPFLAGIALLGAVIWLIFLTDRKSYRKNMLFYLVIITVIAITNPLFNHRGSSPIFFLNGNAVTLEALSYGVVLGVKMAAVFAYSACFSKVFNTNDFYYLFSKVSSKSALLLSMALSFLPRYRVQAKKLRKVQATMGMYGTGSVIDRILSEVRVFDQMITWSLENGVVTADSMTARGYGTGKRSSYHLYRFTTRDGIRLIGLLVLFGGGFFGISRGAFICTYYPAIEIHFDGMKTILYGIYISAACLLPGALELKEKIRWNVLESRI